MDGSDTDMQSVPGEDRRPNQWVSWLRGRGPPGQVALPLMTLTAPPSTLGRLSPPESLGHEHALALCEALPARKHTSSAALRFRLPLPALTPCVLPIFLCAIQLRPCSLRTPEGSSRTGGSPRAQVPRAHLPGPAQHGHARGRPRGRPRALLSVSSPRVESLTSQSPPRPLPRHVQAAFPDGERGKPVRKPVRAGSLSSGPAVHRYIVVLRPCTQSQPPRLRGTPRGPSLLLPFWSNAHQVHSAHFPSRHKPLPPAPLIQSSSTAPLRLGGQPVSGHTAVG